MNDNWYCSWLNLKNDQLVRLVKISAISSSFVISDRKSWGYFYKLVTIYGGDLWKKEDRDRGDNWYLNFTEAIDILHNSSYWWLGIIFMNNSDNTFIAL